MKYFFWLLAILILSCIQKEKFNSQNTANDIDKKNLTNDSILEKKYKIKEEISNQYTKLSSLIFESKDGIDYSKYEEAIKLDSLFKQYALYDLSDKEKQFFAIAKYKTDLKLAKYSEAIDELNSVLKGEDFESYKNVLLGIAYGLKGARQKQEYYFNKLYKQYEDFEPNTEDECKKYFILKVLSDSKELNTCQDQLELYKELESMGKIEIIRKFILSNLEL